MQNSKTVAQTLLGETAHFKLFDDEDINQALLQREAFTCTPCLAEVSPKMVIEDETFEKMLQLGNNISQLAAIEYHEIPPHHESGTDVELEEASDELPKAANNVI